MSKELGILIAQTLLRYGPEVALALANLFSKPTHTIEDWKGVFSLAKSYDQMDAESKARVGTA